MHASRESNEFRFHLFELKSTVGRFGKLNLKSTLCSWKHSNRLPLHHLPCDYKRLNPEMVLKKSYCLVQANILRALMTRVSTVQWREDRDAIQWRRRKMLAADSRKEGRPLHAKKRGSSWNWTDPTQNTAETRCSKSTTMLSLYSA